MDKPLKYILAAAIGASIIAGGFYITKNTLPEKPAEIMVQNKEINIPSPTQIVAGNKITAPALSEIKNCLGGEKVGDCLDGLFKTFFDNGGTTVEALAALNKYESDDSNFRLACHPVIHAVGRETFIKHPTVHDAFAQCDQTCHSGCYHGAMERFLRGNQASNDEAGHISQDELIKKAGLACSQGLPLRLKFQCLHGLGHALVFYLDYDLERSLAVCEKQSDSWSQSSCYGGIFMENVHSATPEKRDLSRTDYHYPCSKLAENFKGDCYTMQTTRMTELGLSTEKIFEECKKAGNQQFQCFQSAGRDLSNDVRVGDPKAVAAKCEMAEGNDRNACVLGVLYALLDNTWNGKYAFSFCASLANPGDTNYCFERAVSYLKYTYEKTSDDISSDCETYLKDADTCKEITEK